MKSVIGITTICSLSIVSMLSAQDRLAADLLKNAKAATALVELPAGKGYGSAFCVNKKGYFVTNQHVAEGSRQADTITLVLFPNQENQKIVKAKVLRVDESTDLALLKAETAVEVPALVLGQDGNIEETAQVTALGFPFGKALAGEEGTYPAVSVNVGHITSLRKKKGTLNRIQVDVMLNPGNSGGPVLDTKGEVIGVVVAGIFGTGVNFIIPVSHVARFVAKPQIGFTPPELAVGKLHLPVEFTASATGPADFGQKYDLELVLTIGKLTQKQIKMEPIGDGMYRCKTVLVSSLSGERPLNVEATFPSALIKCQVVDRPITVGEMKLKLSEVQTLNLGTNSGVTAVSGTNFLGKIGGLNAVQCSIGKQTVSLDLAQATTVQVEDLFAVYDIGYSIIAKQGDQILETEEGVMGVEGAAGTGPVVKKGLILYYPFDKDEGDKVTDKSGKGQDGKVKGAAWTAKGRSGGALRFNGVDDHVVVPNSDSLGMQELTLAAWIRPAALGGLGRSGMMIMEKRPHDGCWELMHFDNGRLLLRGASPVTVPTEPGIIVVDKWQQVVATISGTQGILYLDGKRVHTTTVAPVAVTTGEILIGAGRMWNSSDDHYEGLMDEVMIFNRALSDTEVKALCNARTPLVTGP